MISFIFLVPTLLKRIIAEKQEGVKVFVNLFKMNYSNLTFFESKENNNFLVSLGTHENDGTSELAPLAGLVLKLFGNLCPSHHHHCVLSLLWQSY